MIADFEVGIFIERYSKFQALDGRSRSALLWIAKAHCYFPTTNCVSPRGTCRAARSIYNIRKVVRAAGVFRTARRSICRLYPIPDQALRRRKRENQAEGRILRVAPMPCIAHHGPERLCIKHVLDALAAIHAPLVAAKSDSLIRKASIGGAALRLLPPLQLRAYSPSRLAFQNSSSLQNW